MSKTSLFGPTQIGTIVAVVLAVLALGFAIAPSTHARTSASPARPMIARPVVEANSVQPLGNIRPEANAVNDRGWPTISHAAGPPVAAPAGT
jgi:hypothetical protein